MSERKADPAMYARVFEGHHEGVLILEDLVRRFYDVPVYVRGGIEAQRETERRAAMREVVHHILTQIGQVGRQDPNEDEPPAG
jgi:hypothetical protein